MSYDSIANFINFLENQGLKKRVTTLIESRDMYRGPKDCLKDYCRNTKAFGYIDRLGAWRNMHEGHDFWKNINDKWRSTLHNKVEVMPRGIKSIW